MVLARTVYDGTGRPLLQHGLELDRRSLATLTKNRVAELFVEDIRSADVLVHSPIAPELESQAAKALAALAAREKEINAIGGQGSDERAKLRTKAEETTLFDNPEHAINAMVWDLFPETVGEANVSGCLSVEDYDYVQPAKVASLAMVMGRKTGLSAYELVPLGLASLLMNLGYILSPQGTITSPDSLAEKVCQEIPRHPEKGANLLESIGRFAPEVIRAVLEHHERWDGSGYPQRLKREEISPYARLIAIADTYYELVSRRPDRPPYMPHEAVEFILAYSGELFDPELVQMFARVVPLYPTGSTVELSTGELGIISDANSGHIGRPVVRICFDASARAVNRPYDIDLAEAQYQRRLITTVDLYLPAPEE
jgi:HD-GYP domain-containing protein (c-di-GMP phosphodiesterase class II)